MATSTQDRPMSKESPTLTAPTEIQRLLDNLLATVQERLSSLR